MENASKALMIAGAILLVIAIIAIGIGIMNKTKGTIDEAKNQMSSMEIQMYNETFKQYESNKYDYDKTFEEVRECVRTIMTLNKKNENNRDNIIYLTLYIDVFDDDNNSAYYYVDDRLNNNEDQNRKHSTFTQGANDVTIEMLYNWPSTHDKVINVNKHNHSSLYNIRTYTDEKGYINFIYIKKQGPIGIQNPIN